MLSMLGRHEGAILAFAVGLAAQVGSPIPARAEDTSGCTKSYETGQILKKKREYTAARRELLACIRACPLVVQRECGQWLDALETVVPSIVIHAEAAGEDRNEVRV